MQKVKGRFYSGALVVMDLELAAMLLDYLILKISHPDLNFKHVEMYCDNTAAVYWTKKGGATKSIPAVQLLYFLSLHQQTCQTSSIHHLHIE